MNPSHAPSVMRIVRVDPLSTTLVMVPMMLWLLFGAVVVLPAVLNGQPVPLDPWQLLLLIFATLFCWLGAAWRVLTVQEILLNGVVLDGRVTQIWFFSGRGRVKYSFNYEGVEYTPSVPILKNEVTEHLAAGAQVTLVIDPNKPNRAFLRNIFVNS